MKTVFASHPFLYVIVTSADGALFESPKVPLDIVRIHQTSFEGLQEWMEEIVQLDWGNFFLTESRVDVERELNLRDEVAALAKVAVATVRAVDSSTCEVLTESESIAQAVADSFNGKRLHASSYDDLSLLIE